MRDEIHTFPLDVKGVQEESDGWAATFEGLVASFNSVDAQGDMFAPGSFKSDLPFFVANGVVRDEHRNTTGKILHAEETPDGLYIKGGVADTQHGLNQAKLLRKGVYRFLSIGSKNQGKWLETELQAKSHWESHGYTPTDDDLARVGRGPVRLITRAKPYEGSTTWHPANERAVILGVKSATPAGRTYADHLRSVLAAAEEVIGRGEAIREMRLKDGRDLSIDAKSLLSRLGEFPGRLSALLGEIQPEPEPEPPPAAVPVAPEPEPVATKAARDEARSLVNEYHAILARLNGVPI